MFFLIYLMVYIALGAYAAEDNHMAACFRPCAMYYSVETLAWDNFVAYSKHASRFPVFRDGEAVAPPQDDKLQLIFGRWAWSPESTEKHWRLLYRGLCLLHQLNRIPETIRAGAPVKAGTILEFLRDCAYIALDVGTVELKQWFQEYSAIPERKFWPKSDFGFLGEKMRCECRFLSPGGGEECLVSAQVYGPDKERLANFPTECERIKEESTLMILRGMDLMFPGSDEFGVINFDERPVLRIAPKVWSYWMKKYEFIHCLQSVKNILALYTLQQDHWLGAAYTAPLSHDIHSAVEGKAVIAAYTFWRNHYCGYIQQNPRTHSEVLESINQLSKGYEGCILTQIMWFHQRYKELGPKAHTCFHELGYIISILLSDQSKAWLDKELVASSIDILARVLPGHMEGCVFVDDMAEPVKNLVTPMHLSVLAAYQVSQGPLRQFWKKVYEGLLIVGDDVPSALFEKDAISLSWQYFDPFLSMVMGDVERSALCEKVLELYPSSTVESTVLELRACDYAAVVCLPKNLPLPPLMATVIAVKGEAAPYVTMQTVLRSLLVSADRGVERQLINLADADSNMEVNDWVYCMAHYCRFLEITSAHIEHVLAKYCVKALKGGDRKCFFTLVLQEGLVEFLPAMWCGKEPYGLGLLNLFSGDMEKVVRAAPEALDTPSEVLC